MSAGIAGDFGPVVDCVEEFHCWVYMWAFPGPASFPPKEHTCSWSRARAALHSTAHIWSGFRDFTAFCCCATVSSAGPHLGYLLHQHVDTVWFHDYFGNVGDSVFAPLVSAVRHLIWKEIKITPGVGSLFLTWCKCCMYHRHIYVCMCVCT